MRERFCFDKRNEMSQFFCFSGGFVLKLSFRLCDKNIKICSQSEGSISLDSEKPDN